jgi:hypothetical protein
MRTCVVLLACLVSQATCAAASTPLPKAVQTALDQVAAVCSEVEGKPITKDAIKRADLNADGREDYVLDVGAVVCDGAASIYGDREKALAVLVGDGKGGATEAFSDSAFGTRIEREGARAKLWLAVMGAQCGKKPAKDFASETFCERPLVWDPAKRKFDYAPVSSAKILN